jgi:hypothetical protein
MRVGATLAFDLTALRRGLAARRCFAFGADSVLAAACPDELADAGSCAIAEIGWNDKTAENTQTENSALNMRTPEWPRYDGANLADRRHKFKTLTAVAGYERPLGPSSPGG